LAPLERKYDPDNFFRPASRAQHHEPTSQKAFFFGLMNDFLG